MVGQLGHHLHVHRVADQGQRQPQVGQGRPQADLVSPAVTVHLPPWAAKSNCPLPQIVPASRKLTPAPHQLAN